jgi:hypothetical protein
MVLHSLQHHLPLRAEQVVAAACKDVADYFARAARSRASQTPLPSLGVASAELLNCDGGTVTLRAAEAVYNIDMLMKRHAVFFGQPPKAESPRMETVTA